MKQENKNMIIVAMILFICVMGGMIACNRMKQGEETEGISIEHISKEQTSSEEVSSEQTIEKSLEEIESSSVEESSEISTEETTMCEEIETTTQLQETILDTEEIETIEETTEMTEEATEDTIEETTVEETIFSSEQVEETQKVEIVEKKEATYEEWLAAGMVVAISMQYPDFSLENIYLASETEVNNKENSAGAYVCFISEGEEYIIQSLPLNEERTTPGTIDIYTRDLGFATFDKVEHVDTSIFRQITMNDLEELIAQSLLVSLYER